MPPKREEDPEEIMKRKYRAMCRFRMLGRLVVENLGWMSEGIAPEPEKPLSAIFHDILYKKKLLTLQDKYLMSINNTWRSTLEKEHLYKIMGGLKCFRFYPKNVRRYLCAVAYFKYFGPGRVLVRSGHVANAMYYIVSGQVQAIGKIYDAYTKKWVDGFAGILKSGDEFGQNELLHNEVRPLTYKSITCVELICIMKEDFNSVLEITIQRHWDDIKRAMAQFTYFSSLSKEAILQGCMLAKMKYYKPDETILGDGKGLNTFVYFILSGTCQLIDTLLVKETKYIRKKIYSLYTLKDQPLSQESAFPPSSLKKSSKDDSEVDLKDKRETSILQDLKFEDQVSINPSNVSSSSSRRFEDSDHDSVSLFTHRLCNLPDDVKVHFMQICLMNAGGCFGWEDSMEARRMIALSDVKCLLLPKQWLWQWNPHNIWHRIKHYYEMKIPSKKEAFKSFAIDRKWDVYKEDLIKEIQRDKKAVNCTRRQDVPYSIIIKENLNLRDDYKF